MSDEQTEQERDAAVIAKLRSAAERAAFENHAQGATVRFIEDYFDEAEFEKAIPAALRTIDRLTAERDAARAEVALAWAYLLRYARNTATPDKDVMRAVFEAEAKRRWVEIVGIVEKGTGNE